jgi:hypothetical protein
MRAPRLNPPSLSTVRLLRGKFKRGGKLEAFVVVTVALGK